MTVRINKFLCNGCNNAIEPRCVMVCPGDLLYKNSSNQAGLREPRDCWDCGACVKECPREALELFLPVQIGGRGSTLKASTRGNRLYWQLQRFDGRKEEFEILTMKESKER